MAKQLTRLVAAKAAKPYTWPKAKAGIAVRTLGVSDASVRVIRGTSDSMHLALKRLASK